ncbi:MAG: NAAT family transporter [Elusimicrobia bacterium]|nr:NAAT family transporter [Elusimicrobiota bacterium]
MSMLEYTLLTISTLFAIINPVAAIPAFLAMTFSDSHEARLRMARVACITCSGVLIAFAFLGRFIFKIFGISIYAFQIAGGIVLLLVAMDMLRAKRSAIQETEEEKIQATEKTDIAITPLAIPMLSGPGAISTVIVLSSQAEGWPKQILLIASIFAASAASFGVLRLGVRGATWLNQIAMNIITRLMGLLLAAIAVQFIGQALPQLLRLKGP